MRTERTSFVVSTESDRKDSGLEQNICSIGQLINTESKAALKISMLLKEQRFMMGFSSQSSSKIS